MTDITQQHIAVLVKRLRTTVMPRRTSPQDKAIIDNLMDAADMLEQLAAERDRALEWRDHDRERALAAEARAEAAEAAIQAALKRLDASLFTNAEHQQAKDILRDALKEKPHDTTT